MFDFDPQYVFYGLVAASAMMLAEGAYLLFFSGRGYRRRINRRLAVLSHNGDKQDALLQLRRERGLTGSGDFRLPVIAFNRLVTQSGLSIGLGRLAFLSAAGAAIAAAAVYMIRDSAADAVLVALLAFVLGPYAGLRIMRARRQKAFGAQFPDAIDLIVRSLRAGHPVPIAVGMVARELPDPLGSEFGLVADEITFGSDLETAMRNLYVRIGQDDLPLFVTAVAIQGTTGGNLGEILGNLSAVIRQRFKMRRKVRALAAEGKMSAMLLSALPIGIFFIVQMVSPDFYGSVWQFDMTKNVLSCAAAWMLAGNIIMFRMVNFKI